MNFENQLWQSWAENLHRWGIQEWVAALFESASPLGILGAQAIYLSQPLLDAWIPTKHLNALAMMLEEPLQMQSFATFLREGSSREPA